MSSSRAHLSANYTARGNKHVNSFSFLITKPRRGECVVCVHSYILWNTTVLVFLIFTYNIIRVLCLFKRPRIVLARVLTQKLTIMLWVFIYLLFFFFFIIFDEIIADTARRIYRQLWARERFWNFSQS